MTTPAFTLPRTFKMVTLILASAALVACDDDATGIDRNQGSADDAVGSVQGLVTANGQGVSGIAARFSRDGVPILLVETDADGRFFLDALPVGEYEVELQTLGRFELPADADTRRAITTQSVFIFGGITVNVDFDLFEKAEDLQNGGCGTRRHAGPCSVSGRRDKSRSHEGSGALGVRPLVRCERSPPVLTRPMIGQ